MTYLETGNTLLTYQQSNNTARIILNTLQWPHVTFCLFSLSGTCFNTLKILTIQPIHIGKVGRNFDSSNLSDSSDGDFLIGPCRLQRPRTTTINRQMKQGIQGPKKSLERRI
jgi:hypothetical protein